MSDAVQSQGQKLAEVSSLLSGSRNVPAEINGESFGLEQVSSRAPTVREERGVRKVPVPEEKDFTAADVSPMLTALSQMQVPTLTPEFFQQGQALEQEITKFWDAASELMEAANIAEQRGDFAIAANFKIESGSTWAAAQGMRQQWLQMKGHYEQVQKLNWIIGFQKQLLEKHPFLASKKEWERCLKWAMREYDAQTPEQVLWAEPEQIAAGLDAYVAHCKATGYKLGRRTAVERGNASIVSAKAKALSRQGKLTPARQAELVSELLSSGGI